MEKDKNILAWIFIAVVAIIFLIGSFGIGSYGMMGFGFLFMLLFWGFIIWIVVTLINTSQSNKNDNSDSLAILKKRYASGEINKKQYEEMKKELVRR